MDTAEALAQPCPRCGTFLDAAARVDVSGTKLCTRCFARVGASAPRSPAWEERPGADGLWAFAVTLWQLARPLPFFRALPRQGVWSAVRFALICHSIRCLAALLPTTVQLVAEVGVHPSIGQLYAAQVIALMTAALVAIAVASGLFRIFVLGSLEHLLLRLSRCASAGYVASLRANGYAHGSSIVGLLPVFWWGGEVAHALWRFAGYRGVHGSRGGRAIALVLVVTAMTGAYLLSQDLVHTALRGVLLGFQESR